jgi:hypothetical protein
LQAVADLQLNGYHQFKRLLAKDKVTRIKHALSRIAFRRKKHWRLEHGVSADYRSKHYAAALSARNQSEILSVPAVQELPLGPVILGIAQDYLCCPPILVQANAWLTFAHDGSPKELSKNAQQYHQDKEYVTFVKVFVYLTDVNTNSGPHCYISGSHRDCESHVFPGYRVRQRPTDEYLRSKYGAGRFLEHIGPDGTILIEDTTGFHKGKPVLRGHRFIFQFEYTSTLYFHGDRYSSQNDVGIEQQLLMQRWPRCFLLYDENRYEMMLKSLRRELHEAAKRSLKDVAFAPARKVIERVRSARRATA